MKARTHYTTPITKTSGMRRSMRALAALFVLLAGSFALITALRLAPAFTAAVPAASTRPAPISSCQACRDEWIAAMQPSHVRFVPAPATLSARERYLTLKDQQAEPRVFRDEVLGADQAHLGSITIPAGVTLEAQQEHLRKTGPR